MEHNNTETHPIISKPEKLKILKFAIIDVLLQPSGICDAIKRGCYKADLQNLHSYPPYRLFDAITHSNYLKFYRFTKVVIYYAENCYWDLEPHVYAYNKKAKWDFRFAQLRRAIFLIWVLIKVKLSKS